MRTQGGKRMIFPIHAASRGAPRPAGRQSLQRVLALLPDSSAFQTSATVRGLISTSFTFLHPALPTRIRVMLACVIGSGEGPWLSGAPERFSSSPAHIRAMLGRTSENLEAWKTSPGMHPGGNPNQIPEPPHLAPPDVEQLCSDTLLSSGWR